MCREMSSDPINLDSRRILRLSCSSRSARYRGITGTSYADKCGHVSAVKASARKADLCIIFNRPMDLTTSSRSRCRSVSPSLSLFHYRRPRALSSLLLKRGCCLLHPPSSRCADFLLLFNGERGRSRDKGGMTRSQRPVKRWSLSDNAEGDRDRRRRGSEPAPSGKTPAGACGGRKKTIPFSHHKRVLPPSIPLPAAYRSFCRCTRARFECVGARLWDIFSFLPSRFLCLLCGGIVPSTCFSPASNTLYPRVKLGGNV